jgi:putative hydrolase of HD superfamily
MEKELRKTLAFLTLAEKLKLVSRATYFSDLSRRESVPEHAWHMALLALTLHPKLSFTVNMERVMILILVHDIPEIEAGDSFAYDPEHDQLEAERAAAKNIFGELPTAEGLDLLAAWEEFSTGDSAEAQFARACDRLQALIQNVASQGRVWQEHGITQAMSRELNRGAMSLDPALAEMFDMLYAQAQARDLFSEEEP